MINLALVVESRRVSRPEATEVAAALQRQISRDFSPLWGVVATIDPFHALEDVPPGYWPILLRSNFPTKGIIGIHLDDRGQPFALVKDVPNWPFIASHEVLEMLADPTGNRLIPGGSPKPGQGLVDYLVEVCDPCASPEFGYTVNGILVSDFITPAYYDPMAVPGGRYSFSGHLDRPRGILRDGYVSFRNPVNGEWWRADRIGHDDVRFSSLGNREYDGRPLRERIDLEASLPVLYRGVPDDHPAARTARVRRESTRAASLANALALNLHIDGLLVRAGRSPAPRPPAQGDRVGSGGRPRPPDLTHIVVAKRSSRL